MAEQGQRGGGGGVRTCVWLQIDIVVKPYQQVTMSMGHTSYFACYMCMCMSESSVFIY